MVDKQMTFANTSDIDTVETFVENIDDMKAFYADKAYNSKEVDELLKNKEIENMICLKEKQTFTKEQIKQQREDERPKHKIRAKVEHRFAEIKTQMNQATTRYIGLVRNNMNFTIVCIAANLKLLAHKKMRGKLELIG